MRGRKETGLQVKDLQYLASYYYEKRDMLMLGYVVEVELDDFKISGEVDAIKWFKLDEANHYVREGSIAYEHLVRCRESRK